MKKIAIIVDSFSGFSKAEVEKLGLDYINHTVILNGKSYKEGIEIKLEDSIEDIQNDLKAKTSMPAIGVVLEAYEKLSKEFDQVIYIPMNKGLSSTYSTAFAASNDFDNVNVISTSLVSASLIETAVEMKKLISAGKSIDEATKFLRKVESTAHAYVIPKNVDALIRSGRLTSAKKFVMQKAKLIPKLEVTMEGFKLVKVGRNMGKIIRSTVEKVIKEIQDDVNNYIWEVIHTGDLKTKLKVIEAFKEVGVIKIKETWSASAIAIHTGIGAIGINVWKK